MEIVPTHLIVLLIILLASVTIVAVVAVRSSGFRRLVTSLGLEYLGDGVPFRSWGPTSVPPAFLTRMEGYEVENFCRGTFNGIETECFDCKIIRGDSEFQELTAKRLTVIGFRIKDNKFPEFQLRHKHSTDSAATESLKAGDSIFILGDLVISGWNSKAIEETITPKLAERLVEIVKDLYFLEKAGDWTICYRKSVPLSQLEEFFTVSHQVAVLLQK